MSFRAVDTPGASSSPPVGQSDRARVNLGPSGQHRQRAGGQPNKNSISPAPRFQQTDGGIGIFGKPRGQCASRRTATNNHIIILHALAFPHFGRSGFSTQIVLSRRLHQLPGSSSGAASRICSSAARQLESTTDDTIHTSDGHSERKSARISLSAPRQKRGFASVTVS